MRENDVGNTFDDSVQAVLARYSSRIEPPGREFRLPPVSDPFDAEACGVRVVPLKDRNGFSGARIWRVVTPLGDFALRRWPASELPRTRILGLHHLLEHLRRDGLTTVAVPCPTNDGTTLPNQSGFDWQLEPWMPGVADFRVAPSGTRLRAAMKSLAEWHSSASRHRPAAEVACWFGSRTMSPAAITDRLTILGRADMELHRIEAGIQLTSDSARQKLVARILELFRRGRDRIQEDLRPNQEIQIWQQPCLRDVWHDHVLFVENRVTGLIDPAACRTDTVASDLSRLIGSLVGDSPLDWNAALEEYERHRPLNDSERKLVAVLNRSGVLLSGWTWLDWLYVKNRVFSNTEIVQKRLEELLSRMEHLVEGNAKETQLFLP